MELLTADEGKLAVRIARASVAHAVSKLPEPSPALPQIFREKRGVFVTLTKDDQLRGCIGLPYPVMLLGEALRYAAKSAALEDPRFPPVRSDELASVSLEVTILTVPIPLEGKPEDRPAKVVVGRHGLIVKGMGTSGLLLPQVATEYGWDAETFLFHTCQKAGLSGNCWTSPRVEFLTFEGQIFSEKESGGTV